MFALTLPLHLSHIGLRFFGIQFLIKKEWVGRGPILLSTLLTPCI